MIRQTFWQRFAASRVGLVGLAVLLVVLLVALTAPILFPGDPFAIVGRPFQPPSAAHLFGTDSLGRDMATCLAYGAFTSLMIGLMATTVALVVGTLIGAFAGFYGGIVDNVLMRLTELFQTIPSFIFAIVLVAILSPSLTSTITAIAVVSWPPIARLVRGEFMTLRRREYVEAAIVLGMGDLQTIFRQILPNCLSPIIVTGSLLIATAILIESALAFLGLGDSNVMSWGFMIGSGRTYLRSAWWLCAIPGFAILMTVLAINLVGEGLNDALNPRLRTL